MFVADTQESSLQSMAGENVTYWSKVMAQATKFFPASKTNFVAHGGDLTNYGSEMHYWREMLGSVQDYMFDMPLMQTPGNHEDIATYGNGVPYIMYNMYNIDIPDQDYTNGYYFSFDLGPLHFVILNTNEAVSINYQHGNGGAVYMGGNAAEGINDVAVGAGRLESAQVNWVKNDLKQNRSKGGTKWTIVLMHEGMVVPTISTNLSISHAYMLRKQLMSTFDEYNVDVVLNGHNHYIQTSNPLKYDERGSIRITTVDDFSANANRVVYEPLLKIADDTYTLNSTEVGYEGYELVDFGQDYQSGVGGTIFHQIGTTGMQYHNYFKEAKLAENLLKYNGLYNNLRDAAVNQCINDPNAYSMFSYLEIDGEKEQLVVRNFGVHPWTTYEPSGKQLKYFGGFIVRK